MENATKLRTDWNLLFEGRTVCSECLDVVRHECGSWISSSSVSDIAISFVYMSFSIVLAIALLANAETMQTNTDNAQRIIE